MLNLKKIGISMVAALMAFSSSGTVAYAEEAAPEEEVVIEEAAEEVSETEEIAIEETEAEPAAEVEADAEITAEETTDAYEATFAGVVTDAGEYVDSMTIDFGNQTISGLDKDTFSVYMTSTVDYGAAKGQPYAYFDASKPLPVVKTEVDGGTVKVYFDQAAAPVLTWLAEGRNYPAILSFTIEQNKPLQTILADGKALDFTASYFSEATSWADLENEELAKFENVQDEINYQFHKGTNDKLIVFFHGNGEGDFPTKDTNNNVAQILANRGGAAWVSEAQEVFGDASVMAFQAPNMWYFAIKDGLLAPVYNEIQAVIAENGINPDEVYLSGASAGGFMSTRMIIAYPDLFKAAMINCPALDAANARSDTTTAIPTDSEIASIKNSKTAIWLVQGETDSSVDPELCSKRIWNLITDDAVVTEKTYEGTAGIASGFTTYETTDGKYKLSLYETFDLGEVTGISGEKRLGGKLKFAEDYDQDGVLTEVKYSDHWSWIYTLRNNPEAADGKHIWNWAVDYEPAVEVTGTQTVVVTGDDWGPAVEKTVIKADAPIDAESLIPANFKVVETKEVPNWAAGGVPTTQTAERKVLDVYASDENGNKLEGGEYVAVVMYISPSEGSPFFYELGTGFNRWVDQYNLKVNAQVTTEGKKAELTADTDIDFYDNDMWVSEVADKFNQDTFTASDKTPIVYGEFVPEDGGQDKALVIWLHGAGEGTNKGKNDNYIDLLGNEVTAFAGEEFQSLFGGAYVVTPQAPTMWMDDGTGAYQSGDKGSVYADALFEFIQNYVDSHLDIDPNRVIIGGCSNGGYMTMEMILKHPDYFYKAFPICEAFADEFITDEQIKALAESGTGIWFTFADADTTVDPTATSIPTYNRLVEAGADVHKTQWADVHDTTGRFVDADGNPYVYMGHWSWIYFDNNSNICDEHGENEWEWLAEVPEGAGLTIRGTQKIRITGDDWGAGVDRAILHLTKEIDPESVARDDFTVTNAFNGGEATERTVLKAYTSDAEGNKVDEASEYVTVELRITPREGNPILWSMQTWTNSWADPYELFVNITDGQEINTADGQKVTGIAVNTSFDVKEVENEDVLIPQLDGYEYSTFTAKDGMVIPYGLYAPEEDDKKNALIIWNHGVGERGSDPRIALLGNEVTALNSEEFQALFEGAYVLVPQTPASGRGNIVNGKIELIEKLVAENPDIDPNRVIVGGCSMGGGQTMNMVYARADLFAAAYPVCPASNSSQVSDEQINNIANLPIWFTHCINDGTVNYKNTTEALIERLKAAGNENVHLSAFEDVHDTTGRFNDLTEDGSDYVYDTHWSWVYFDNNECYCAECGENEWEWLAKQNRLDRTPGVDGVQVVRLIGDDWGAGIDRTIVQLEKAIDPASVDAETFTVEQTNYGALAPRTILDAYVSDEEGNKVDEASEYITIEMRITPSEGNPIQWSMQTWTNSWADPFEVVVNIAEGKNIWSADDEEIREIVVDPAIDIKEINNPQVQIPQLEGYEYSTYTATDGMVIPYGLYTPENADDGNKHALIIWNHGVGERGSDPRIALLGNEVTALNSEEFQALFDGAYVLVPQTPSSGRGNIVNGKIELVEKMIADENLNVDADRVIVGGCSMGGGQTMNMVYARADLFAAAYPICPASTSRQVTDEQIENISRLAIWFTHCTNDDTVNYASTTEALIERLKAAGNENVHLSAFEDVHDTTGRFNDLTEDGSDYQYATHWSWVYFDNNECYCDECGENEWEWLAKQNRLYNLHEGVFVTENPDENSNSGYIATFVYKTDEDLDKVTVFGGFQFFTEEEGDRYLTGYTGGIEAKDAFEAAASKHVMYPYGYDPVGGRGQLEYELEEVIDGVWTVSLPLPADQWFYAYNITKDGVTTKVEDPTNPYTLNPNNGNNSGWCVFWTGTPEDALGEMGRTYPREDEKVGTYEYKMYTNVKGDEAPIVVYLPYEYDSAKTYPVLYISHGGGGNEMDWPTVGAVKNIFDNAIANGEVEPTIVVSMNNTELGWNYDNIRDNLQYHLFPYMEENYNASPDAKDRAFAGLSMGGLTATNIYTYAADQFGYIGIWSATNGNLDVKSVPNNDYPTVMLGAGKMDFGNGGYPGLIAKAAEAGLDWSDDMYYTNDAHNWFCWPDLLSTFASKYLWSDADKAANVEYEESEPGANVDGKTVTFVYEDDDARNAVKVTVQGNMQWYKWDEVEGYDAAGDNSHMHNYDAYHYEEGMFNTGYGINGDTAVYQLSQTSDEHFELALDLPGNLYYYDYTVYYADGSKKTIKDPANMPEANPANGHDAGHSLVYVGSADDTTAGQEYIYERTDDQKGSYEFVPYKAVDGTTQYLGVYLPKDYDEANTYKVVYVSHGGGGQENEWMTIGAVPNILDNLIADGEVEPTIAVTMDNTYFGWNFDTIAKNFEEAIFPYMEKNYSVSGRAEDRALCGLSMGSMTTSTIMLKYPALFGYYGAFSGSNIIDAADVDELAKKVIYLSAGAVDMAYYQSKPVGPAKTVDIANLLKELGISFNNGTDEPDVLGGAHDWGVWRESFSIFAKDYLWTVEDDRFVDVRDESKYYYDAVYWARDNGITKGYAEDNTFRPDEGCTRAQMVTFLWRMAGKPEPSADAKTFPDVKSNQYYYKAVLWAAENGITKGYKDGTFKPDDTCLREHAVTFLYRFAGQPAPKTTVNPFNDVTASDYYYKATLWANENGIAKGYSTGSHAGGFGPKLECLREHIVTFLYRYSK